MKALMRTDGGSVNPGPSAWAYIIWDDEGEIVKQGSGKLNYATNNQAEWEGLIQGLEAALSLGIDILHVEMDSSLVVNQVLGQWGVKNEGLKDYHRRAVVLKNKFDGFRIRHIPRELNAQADELVNCEPSFLKKLDEQKRRKKNYFSS